MKAEYALQEMKEWYVQEKIAKEKEYSFKQRLSMRKEHIKESMDSFHTWLIEQVKEESPTSPVRKACEYALGQWDGFEPFLNDGCIELSNILVLST